jgi:hypothetical protein
MICRVGDEGGQVTVGGGSYWILKGICEARICLMPEDDMEIAGDAKGC